MAPRFNDRFAYSVGGAELVRYARHSDHRAILVRFDSGSSATIDVPIALRSKRHVTDFGG